MSDFGTIISATKKSGAVITEDENRALSDALKVIIDAGEYINFMKEPFSSEFIQAEGESTLQAQLSEYFYGDDEDDDLEEFNSVEDFEAEQAQAMCVKLAKEFPEWDFSCEVTEW